MKKFESSITWIETGIEYYQGLLRKMMHKEIRRAYREILGEFASAIVVLRREQSK